MSVVLTGHLYFKDVEFLQVFSALQTGGFHLKDVVFFDTNVLFKEMFIPSNALLVSKD